MKWKVMVAALLCLAVGHANAQKEEFKKALYFGVGGGMLSSSIDFMPSKTLLFNTGVHGGVSAKFISEKNLGLIIELNYAQKGWKEEFDEESDYEYGRQLQYVELPFMTHVYFGNRVRFVFNAGPQIGFMLGDKTVMNDSFAEYLEYAQETAPDEPAVAQYFGKMRKFDYGLTGGLGIEFNTGIGLMQLEGRYYFGLGDIFENRDSKGSIFSRSANRNIVAKLTYYFQLK